MCLSNVLLMGLFVLTLQLPPPMRMMGQSSLASNVARGHKPSSMITTYQAVIAGSKQKRKTRSHPLRNVQHGRRQWTNNGHRRQHVVMPPLRPFVLKCPHTNKNVSAVVWSHNGTVLFGVNFTATGDGRQLAADVLNESDGPMSGKALWRTADGGMGLIFLANRGRYKVEVEDGGGGRWLNRRWFALRINEMDVREDRGEWKCQVLIRDTEAGPTRVGAESRKTIENGWVLPESKAISTDTEMEYRQRHMRKREHIGDELEGRVAEGNTFAFSKIDTDFVVFERKDSSAGVQSSNSLRGSGDAIEYIRMGFPSDNFDNNWITKWGRNGSSGNAHLSQFAVISTILTNFLYYLFKQ